MSIASMREFVRFHALEFRLIGGVVTVGFGSWQFATSFQSPSLWSLGFAIASMVLASQLLWPVYTRIQYLEEQADIRGRLDAMALGSVRQVDNLVDLGYLPRRSFSPRTVIDIRTASIPLPELRKRYDLDEIEARLLVYAENIDQFGRIAE